MFADLQPLMLAEAAAAVMLNSWVVRNSVLPGTFITPGSLAGMRRRGCAAPVGAANLLVHSLMCVHCCLVPNFQLRKDNFFDVLTLYTQNTICYYRHFCLII